MTVGCMFTALAADKHDTDKHGTCCGGDAKAIRTSTSSLSSSSRSYLQQAFHRSVQVRRTVFDRTGLHLDHSDQTTTLWNLREHTPSIRALLKQYFHQSTVLLATGGWRREDRSTWQDAKKERWSGQPFGGLKNFTRSPLDLGLDQTSPAKPTTTDAIRHWVVARATLAHLASGGMSSVRASACVLLCCGHNFWNQRHAAGIALPLARVSLTFSSVLLDASIERLEKKVLRSLPCWKASCESRCA
jgi:hypothetical protein